jgi:hypothetical protein
VTKKIFRVNDSKNFRALILEAIMDTPSGYVVTIQPETRTTDQNALLWALLTDISEQVEWHGQKLASEDWKHIFTAALRSIRVVPNLTGDGIVMLGQSTSKMTKPEFSELIELIQSFAVDKGVEFHGP